MKNGIEIRWHGRGGQGAKQLHYYLLMLHLKPWTERTGIS